MRANFRSGLRQCPASIYRLARKCARVSAPRASPRALRRGAPLPSLAHAIAPIVCVRMRSTSPSFPHVLGVVLGRFSSPSSLSIFLKGPSLERSLEGPSLEGPCRREGKGEGLPYQLPERIHFEAALSLPFPLSRGPFVL